MAHKNAQQLIKETFLELATALETGRLGTSPAIALTAPGGEHGEQNALNAALLAKKHGVDVHYIGSLNHPDLTCHPVQDEAQAHEVMERLMGDGTIQGTVTMHYPFPIGVATVGRAIAPSTGREIFLATTTGTAATDRVEALVRGAICGIITAKACGIKNPTVGLLNIDGARQAETMLKKLQANGFDFTFAASARAGGGCIMRGNDLLLGSCDVMVMDSLTGNVVIKMLSAFTSGGNYETVGYGYGPGIGENYDKLVLIVSRASGEAVVANALKFASQLAQNVWQQSAKEEFEKAYKAGLKQLLEEATARNKQEPKAQQVAAPPQEPVTTDIAGIEVMELEDAVTLLWQEGIYAQSGMGCTGPVVMVNEQRLDKALGILKTGGFIG